MVRSKANIGRLSASSFGSFPVLAYSRTVASSTYGFGGHPGMFTTGFDLISESTPTAPVGFGPEEGTPPQDAHEPMEMTAAARAATSLSSVVPFLPAIFR